MTDPNRARDGDRRYTWYVVCLLLVVYMVHHLDRMVITLVLEPIGHEFKLSDSQLGLLAGVAYAVPFAIAGLPLGMLIDRVRRVRLLALLLTTWSGLTALCALAGSYWTLVLARAGVAAAESGGTPANMSIISDYVPAQRRGSAFGVYYMGPHLGTIIGFSIAGAVAAAYGWRAAFLVVGVPGLLLAGLVARTIREPRRGGELAAAGQTVTLSAPPSLAVALKTLWSRRAALHLIVACTIANMVAAGLSTWLPALLIRSHGADLRTVGIAIAFGIAPFAAMGSLLGGRLVDLIQVRSRARVATFLAVCTAITIPAAASGIMSAGMVGVVIAFAVQGVAHVCLVGPSYAAVMERVPAETRGITAAVMQVSSNVLGFGVGAQVVGVGSDLLHATAGDQSLRLAMLIFSFVNLLAIAHYLRAASLIRRETVQPSGGVVLAR